MQTQTRLLQNYGKIHLNEISLTDLVYLCTYIHTYIHFFVQSISVSIPAQPNWYTAVCPRVIGRDLKLITHLHPIPKLKMSGAVSPLPYIHSCCAQ
jgi:hypothetical protein